MKKKVILIAIAILVILSVIYISGYKKAMTREKEKPMDLNVLIPLIEKDDNYILTSKYYELETRIKGDKLQIHFKNDDTEGTLSATVEEQILSFKIKDGDQNSLLKAMFIYTIVDALGQLNGNDKGYVSTMLGEYDIKKATLDKDGFELENKDDTNIYRFKTGKKFKLGDIKSNYFKIKDLEEYKESFLADTFIQTSKGNIILYKDTSYNKINVFYICEPTELTKRTYNSLLSIIELVYGEEYKNNFQTNYPKLANGLVLDKFDIVVDYQPNDKDVVTKIITDNYKILKVTINN